MSKKPAKSEKIHTPKVEPLPVDQQKALYEAALAGDTAEFERIRDGRE